MLVSFFRDQDKGPQPIMAPFAHIGIEMPTKDDGRRDRREGPRPTAAWSGQPHVDADPIGYICAFTDPDGNVIEFSYDQGVYDKAQEVWG